MCVYLMCVYTCLCLLKGNVGVAKSTSNKITGLMPGEIMTLPNRTGFWVMGEIVAVETMMSSRQWLLSRTTSFMEGGSFNLRRYACRKDCDGCDTEGITCYLACTWYALVHNAYDISIGTSWWQSLLYCICIFLSPPPLSLLNLS